MLYFEKLQGTGNDFIIIKDINYKDYAELARRICDRHYGVGADGLMVVKKSDKADVKMDYYNQDGTIAPMCGNGIRCFAKFVHDNNIVKGIRVHIETLAGVKTVENGSEDIYRVNMGKPDFNTKNIPIKTNLSEIINQEIKLDDSFYHISVINMGTIHTILFVDDLKQIDAKGIGKRIESDPLFPEKTNVNFCEVIDQENINVITYERGVGITLSCGTGSCACAVVSHIMSKTSNKVQVHNLGGILDVEWDDDVTLSGVAKRICTGFFNIKGC